MERELKFITVFVQDRGLAQESFEKVYAEVHKWMKEAPKHYDCDCSTAIDIYMEDYYHQMEDMMIDYYETLLSCTY